jgi:hypothetical protein
MASFSSPHTTAVTISSTPLVFGAVLAAKAISSATLLKPLFSISPESNMGMTDPQKYIY